MLLSLFFLRSTLPKSIQELISMIFDIEQMKRTLIEFEIDTEKMPLGKLSRKQIETGYSILTEALGMLKTGSGSEVKFIDCTNRFFTLIPHDFGLNSPPSKLLSGRHALLDQLHPFFDSRMFRQLTSSATAASPAVDETSLCPFL